MATKTADDLTKEVIALSNKKDKFLAEHKAKAKAKRDERDKLIAKERAAAKLAEMSTDEIEAVKAELGLEA